MADMSLVWIATELTEKGQWRVDALDDRAAAGLSVGSGTSINPKTWPNEDSLAVHRLEDGAYLAAVADAHWGGASGVAVASHLLAAFEKSQGATVRDRLHLALRGIDARFQREKDGQERSETTVLLAYLAPNGRTLDYVSVGDSVLFVVGPEGAKDYRAPGFRYPLAFVGNCPLATIPRSVPPHGETLQLAPGSVVVLATDGIEPEAAGGLTRAELATIVADGPPQARVTCLLNRADDAARGGGNDNLGVVLLLGS